MIFLTHTVTWEIVLKSTSVCRARAVLWYSANGWARSASKSMQRELKVERLGVEFDGEHQRLGVSVPRFLDTVLHFKYLRRGGRQVLVAGPNHDRICGAESARWFDRI